MLSTPFAPVIATLGTAICPKAPDFGPLLRTVSDALIVFDAVSGHIMYWNHNSERIFGYSAGEACGLPIEDLVAGRSTNPFRVALVDLDAADRCQWRSPGEARELVALHKSGAAIQVEVSISPFNQREHEYLIAIVRDCTARKRLEAKRRVQLETAQEQVRRVHELATMKADFTAMIAHELGTAHAVIQAQVDLLGRNVISATDRAQCHASIRSETRVLRRLASDIYLTSTFERDDFAINLQPTEVASLLANVEVISRSLLVNHVWTVDDGPSVRVLADPDRIGQVMRNLLGNAAKHTKPGTPVAVHVTRRDGRVWFEISDQGPGIHLDDIPRIFSKFGRGRNAQGLHVPGAGLGLYLSRRIVKAHGSEIIVVSEPEKGTTFSFALREVP